MKPISLEKKVEICKHLRTEPDPLYIAKHLLKIPDLWLWEGVQRIAASVFKNKYTAVQAGHSLSKDYTAGLLIITWLIKYFPNAKVICTGPKLLQVKDIIFGEIAKQFENLRENCPWSIDPNALQKLRLELGSECYAIGFTTKESGDKMGKASGFKSPNMLVVITEAQAVESSIFDQIPGITTSVNSRVLEVGNPIPAEGKFWEHCTQAHYGYNVIKMSCFDSPNVKAHSEIIPGMVTEGWIEERRREWGEDHPYWIAKVLGEFPQSGANSIIPIEWIMRAIDRHLEHPGEFLDDDILKCAGLDISKGGTDETVHLVLTGRKVTRIDAFHKVDINETVDWIKGLIRNEKIEILAVDEGGLAGVAGFVETDDTLSVSVMRIMFGSKLEDNDQFANLAATMWWALREAFQNNRISIPDDPILIGQLSGRRFSYTTHGQMIIHLESKANARSRGVESPDRADALAMAWWARTRNFGVDMVFNKTERASFAAESEIARVLSPTKREELVLTARSMSKKYHRESADLL